MIGVMVRVMMPWSEGCCCSILIASMVMKSNNCWYLSMIFFNFEHLSCICGDLELSGSLRYYNSELIVMFECSLTYFILWVLWNKCFGQSGIIMFVLEFLLWQIQNLLQGIFYHLEFVRYTLKVLCKWALLYKWTRGILILHPVLQF